MNFPEIYSATGMMELIQKIGFLPLLDSGIEGFSAEDIVAEDCGYVTFPEGGWDWPLWKWKGEIVQEMLHSPDNHLTGKHLQRFYDLRPRKWRKNEAEMQKQVPQNAVLVKKHNKMIGKKWILNMDFLRI